jgi:hypothetical protein
MMFMPSLHGTLIGEYAEEQEAQLNAVTTAMEEKNEDV